MPRPRRGRSPAAQEEHGALVVTGVQTRHHVAEALGTTQTGRGHEGGRPSQLHGPYWHWTRKVDQKTVSKLLSAEQVPDYAEWLANRHRLRELIHELEELGIAALEADPRTPRRAKKSTSS